MKMECYNMRTFFKFINMSKCFLYEINKYIDNKDFYLNYNEGLFLEILKNYLKERQSNLYNIKYYKITYIIITNKIILNLFL